MARTRARDDENTVTVHPGAGNSADELDDDDAGDLVLDDEQSRAIVTYVYRVRGTNEPLPPGVSVGRRGPYVCRFQGPLDLETIRKRIGPGTWYAIGRKGSAVVFARTVEIDGEPWPLSRINPPAIQDAPPPGELAPPAPAPAPQPTTLESVRAIIRDELRALAPPAAVAAPAAGVGIETMFKALELAREFVKPQTPTDPGSVLTAVMDAWKSGIELGRTVNPEAPPADPVSPLFTALGPVLAKMLERTPATAPAPALPPAPVPRAADGVPVLGGAPRPAAPAPAPGPSRAAIAVAEHLARGIARGSEPGAVADAVDLILDEDEAARLSSLEPDQLRGWIAAAGLASPALDSPAAERWLAAFLDELRGGVEETAETERQEPATVRPFVSYPAPEKTEP